MNKLKFSDYFFAPGVRVVAIVIGLLIGIGTSLFLGLAWGAIAGAGTTFLCTVVLPIILYREDLPYAALRESIKQPLLMDQRVNFTVAGGMVNGVFLLTEDQMIFLSLDHGNHRLELARGDVMSVVLEEKAAISIFINHTQFIRVVSGFSREMFEVLRENGWTKTE